MASHRCLEGGTIRLCVLKSACAHDYGLIKIVDETWASGSRAIRVSQLELQIRRLRNSE